MSTASAGRAGARATSGRRMWGVDMARAVALLGMAATHIWPAVTSDGRVHVSHLLASGRAAALFAVLAGVGLSLATGGRRPLHGRELNGARLGVVARAGLLGAVGLCLGTVNSPPAVILPAYAALFVLAVPVLGLRARPLALLAVTFAVLSPVASFLLRRHVPDTTFADLYLHRLLEPATLARELLLTGFYPALTWMAYLLAGLAVGRLDLRSRRTAVGLLGFGAGAAAVAHLSSALLLGAAGGPGALTRSIPAGFRFSAYDLPHSLQAGLFGFPPATDARWLLVVAPHSATTFDLVATTGSAFAVLGAMLLLDGAVRNRRARLALLPLACVGSMTFTLYSLHVLALHVTGPWVLTGLLPENGPFKVWLVHAAVALVLATLWRTLVGRGPLEALAAWLDRLGRRVVGPPRREEIAPVVPGQALRPDDDVVPAGG